MDDKFQDEWSEKLAKDSYADMSKQEVEYTAFGLSMNLVQWKFHCCGVDGISDYDNNTNWPKNDVKYFSFTKY